MTERFPPDCSPVSGRFRNTTFICPGPSTASLRFALTPGLAPRVAPSAASLALRAHSRGLRPPVLVLRLLRFASRFGSPRSTTPLRCAARSRPGCRPVLLLRLLRYALAARVTSLDCSAALRARALSGSFDCSAVLQRARACEISQATGLCYAGGRSGARFFLPAPSISDLSVKELASA